MQAATALLLEDSFGWARGAIGLTIGEWVGGVVGGPERKSASSSFGCGDPAWPAAGLTFLSSVPLRMAQKAARGQLLLHNWVQYLRCRGGTSGGLGCI